MKVLLFLLMLVQASLANVCDYLGAVNAAEPKLILKALTSPHEVESSAEFKQYYSNYYFFIQRGLEAKAVGLYDDFLNEATRCSGSILARIEGFNTKVVAQTMRTKLLTSETLRNHFIKTFGQAGYDKFVSDLKSVESTYHLAHAIAMLPVSGVGALIALATLVSGSNVVAGAAAIVMVAGVGYASYRIYRNFKLDLKTSLTLSAAQEKAISDEAVVTASVLTRNVIKNAKLDQLKTVNP